MGCPQPLIAERAKEGTIKITWAKGHATDEHIASGKTSHGEKARNIEADKLATAGIAMKNADGTMVKAARQRKTVAALQQTKLVKMWLNRPELAALDQAEQQQLDEEAEEITEMQEAFKEARSPQSQLEKMGTVKGSTDEDGRRPWQYVKIEVPAYKWEPEKRKTSGQVKARHDAGNA